MSRARTEDDMEVDDDEQPTSFSQINQSSSPSPAPVQPLRRELSAVLEDEEGEEEEEDEEGEEEDEECGKAGGG